MARMPFIPSAYAGRSVAQESQRFINLYPELASAPGSKSIAALHGTPGLRLFSNGIAPPARGAIVVGNLVYVVESNQLISVDANGNPSASLGVLQTSTGRVVMKYNGRKSAGIGGDQICIVDGAAGYIFNVVTGAFTTINSPGFPVSPAPTAIEYLDGYFIATNGTMSAFASNLFDGLTWNALATTPVEAAPDNVQMPLNVHQQLFFIKEYTTEVYYNNQTATSAGFPYSRIGGAVIDYGTLAPWSAARGDNNIFFLAWQRNDDGGQFMGVVELNGYTPVPISPPAITWRINQSTDLTQCFGYCYTSNGHSFYVLTNPVDNWTLVYDATIQMWHERSSGPGINRHLGNIYVNAFGMHIVGDYLSGRLYEMSERFYTEAGEPLTSIQRTQHLADGDSLANVFIGELQVDIESGVGLDGPSVPATALASVVAGAVSSVTVEYNGADYTGPATVLFQPIDGGTGAAATALVEYGSVTSVTVTAGGSGYNKPPTVVILGTPVKPVASLSISKNGGRTFGNEYPKSMGNVGEHTKRMVWRAVGKARDRVFQLRVSSPVKRVILGWLVEPV